MLNKLPDEIVLYIFTFIADNIKQLIQLSQISKRYHRLLQNPRLWYLAFQLKYPQWSQGVEYASNNHCLIDWKDFVLDLMKQQTSSSQLSFQFVQEHYTRKRKREEEKKDKGAFWIQDPLVVDIDASSHQGVVATGKHRKTNVNNVFNARSEHKILFWEYPSWKLIRVFELQLQPVTLTCQVIGLQSIDMLDNNSNTYKARFFSLAVGITLINDLDTDNEDRADIWKSLFIYRLFDDGQTQCMAHIKIDDLFLGREVFLFSDTSWQASALKDWMPVVLPEHQHFDPQHTVFVLAMGPIYQHITGCVQMAKFDVRGQPNILDPSITPTTWDMRTHQLMSVAAYAAHTFSYTKRVVDPVARPTEMLTSIQLGDHVSCMIHFKYPPTLNHLICTGSSMDDELSIYDWRFGLKVGSLPWKSVESHLVSREEEDAFLTSIQQNIVQSNSIPPFDIHEEEEEEEHPLSSLVDVKPWGLESTFVIPPQDDLYHGFRLIAVGDNRAENSKDKLEIKVWDISYLLHVDWDPLVQDNNKSIVLHDHVHQYLAQQFAWWPRRTYELTKLALCMLQSNHSKYKEGQPPPHMQLPYSPHDMESILLSHSFDKHNEASVKYTAYTVLHTSLFLLTEGGKVTVMDIESGEMIGTVENIAHDQQVIGIDVCIIGGKEVVVTSKEGLLKGTV